MIVEMLDSIFLLMATLGIPDYPGTWKPRENTSALPLVRVWNFLAFSSEDYFRPNSSNAMGSSIDPSSFHYCEPPVLWI